MSVAAEKTESESQRYADSVKSSVPRSNECFDAYPGVVVVLADGRRVIESTDGIQWVIQKRIRGPRPWRPVYYCRTKEGLLLYAGSTPELLALPDYFPERH